MKLLFSGIFTCSLIHAQPVLTLSLQDSSLFTTEIDNQSFSEPQSVMNFFDVPSGSHQLKVYKILKTGNSIVKQNVFEGEILIDEKTSLVAYIDRYNQLRTVSKSPINASSSITSQNRAPIPNPNNIPTNTQQRTNTQGMDNNQFKAILENLSTIEMESDRLKTAKGIISISTIKSSQVAEIMLQFDGEGNRINIADFSIGYVTDPQNYSVVYNAIRSPRSIRKLNRRLSN
jgi:hypothetical protein